MIYQNTAAPEFASTSFLNDAPSQSSQLKGQFAYSRFKNIANSGNLYATSDVDSGDATGAIAYEYSLYDLSSVTLPAVPNSFVWNGTWSSGEPVATAVDTVNGQTLDYDSGIHMHVDHPALASTTSFATVYGNGANHVQSKTAKVNNEQLAYFYDGSEGRTVKMAFEPNDQYLLGGNSCGAYLFMSPLSIDSLSVDADNSSGVRVIKNGESNAVAIDVIFQYRMTDYAGASEANLGFIGGIESSPLSNLTYSKRIGIDILDSENNLFSFDLEVFAKYTA